MFVQSEARRFEQAFKADNDADMCLVVRRAVKEFEMDPDIVKSYEPGS